MIKRITRKQLSEFDSTRMSAKSITNLPVNNEWEDIRRFWAQMYAEDTQRLINEIRESWKEIEELEHDIKRLKKIEKAALIYIEACSEGLPTVDQDNKYEQLFDALMCKYY